MKHCALILPGAVAKGAFEAGVIHTLIEKNTRIDRIVATSSGALNAVAYASAIRSGSEKEMARKLTKLWISEGDWRRSLSFSPLNWFRGKGISGRSGLLRMLSSLITPCEKPRKEVELRIIIAPLNGVTEQIGDKPSTSYEKVLHFSGKDFDTQEGLSRVFDATTAACAFPGLFSAVELPGLGPCVDGGTVNNAPIEYALEEGDVDHIIMPVPFPSLMPPSDSFHGLKLLNHLIEILINQRLYRDLKDAHTVNNEILKLERLRAEGIIDSQQLASVLSILRIRSVKISEIRPQSSLRGNSFSGFFSESERARWIDEGKKAALRSLSETENRKNA